MVNLVLKTAADAAAALDHAQAQVRAGEIASVLAIAALCDLHRVDDQVLVDGAERWVSGGADGTPNIGEFVTAEIAGLLAVSIGAAVDRVHDVLNLRHRHPTLWAHVVAGDIRVWDATRVARACAHAQLDLAACLRVDALCATALAFQPWPRVRQQLHRWILLADPAQAAAREHAARSRRYVGVGEITDGHCGVWGHLDAADGLALDAALTHIADTLNPTHGDVQARRASALGLIARHILGPDTLPTTDLGQQTNTRRRTELIVHVQAADLLDPDSGVASLDRWGHLLLPRLTDLLAGCRVTIRPILPTADLPPVDAYQVPKAMWLAVQARNPVDVFPYGTRPARACQADHTIPYRHRQPARGQTRPANLGPLSLFTHRLKTHGGWQLEQPAPGHYLWRSPLGYHYAVTADGTTLINRPPPQDHDWWNQEPPTHDPWTNAA